MKPDKQHPVAMLSVAFSTWQDEATNQILHFAAHSSRDDFWVAEFGYPYAFTLWFYREALKYILA